MEKINCPICKGVSVKNGLQLGKQRYKCKFCKKQFQLEYSYKACNVDINNFLKSLLKEGSGIRSIARVLNISKNTVLSRILKISSQIATPQFDKPNCKYEIDEMWSFIGNKRNTGWITYTIERESKQVIDFHVGRKTKVNIQPIIAVSYTHLTLPTTPYV